MDCATGTISYSSFGAGGTQEVAILTDLSADFRYQKIVLSETYKFDSISSLTVSMGMPGAATNNKLLDGFHLGLSSGDVNFVDFTPRTPQLTSTYTLVLAFAVPSGALRSASAGVLTWEVCGYGKLNVVQTSPYPPTSYLVGDVAPYTSDTAPSFGDGVLDDADLTLIMFAVNNVPGFRPAACSDRFDAMDLYPLDTASSRGGDGVLDVRDLVHEVLRVNNQDLDRPVRSSRGGKCTGSAVAPARDQRAEFSPGHWATSGRIVLGVPARATGPEQWFPIYLDASRDLARVAVTFALGNQCSRLRFVAAPDLLPTLTDDSRLGVVAVAWLRGVSVRAGGRLLLGHVARAVGGSAALRVYGISAVALEDGREVAMENSAADETNLQTGVENTKRSLTNHGSTLVPPYGRQDKAASNNRDAN
jgi:hypothetical protein